jgi:hypothetical protein
MSKKTKSANNIENSLVGFVSNKLKNESYSDRRVRNDIRLSQLTQSEFDIISRYRSRSNSMSKL